MADWKQGIILSPPHAIIFRDSREDTKHFGSLDITNKSSEHLVFKVKTTEPNNYVVRPNQGIVAPDGSVNVKIVCQVNLN